MRKTEGVRDLVAEVIVTIPRPFSEDITEDIFLAIERKPQWKKQYDQLSQQLRHWVVNNWVGQYTLDLSGMKSVRQVRANRTKSRRATKSFRIRDYREYEPAVYALFPRRKGTARTF